MIIMNSSFEELGLSKSVTDAMEALGWTEPTPIQREAVPAGLEGRDMYARAQTGTGKTGAYASVLLSRTKPGSRRPSALVMAPTRELASQVTEQVYRLSKYTGHRSAAIYGGASIDAQIRMLRRGADIVVGTPGRVRDMIDRGELDPSGVSELVLDEADRMLDMCFAEELDWILDRVPADRHTMLFSATASPGVRELAAGRMRDPVSISVSEGNGIPEGLSQYYISAPRGGKREILFALLEDMGHPKAIVFCGTKSMVDLLTEKLNGTCRVGSIHGDMPQARREKVMRSFRNGSFDLLVATDVAARGLDIDDVDCVVNYDMPPDPETYVHRIGRAARAGRAGTAVSLVTPNEVYRVENAEAASGSEIIRMPRPRAERPERKMKVVKEEPIVQHPEAKAAPAGPAAEASGMTVLEIGIGRAEGFGRSSVAEFVRANAGLGDGDVGRVGLGSSSSYVEVSIARAAEAVAAISRCRRGGRRVEVREAPRKPRYKDTDRGRAERGAA